MDYKNDTYKSWDAPSWVSGEFKIHLNNFEIEEFFNDFDMFDLQEWEFDLLDPVHVQQKDDRENVTLAKEI
jgi:hypothetical protein